MQADGDGSIFAVLIDGIFRNRIYCNIFAAQAGAFLSIQQINGINAVPIFFMKARNTLFAVLMLSASDREHLKRNA
jgi:hypothetical protein